MSQVKPRGTRNENKEIKKKMHTSYKLLFINACILLAPKIFQTTYIDSTMLLQAASLNYLVQCFYNLNPSKF